jgi:hypothetical protein
MTLKAVVASTIGLLSGGRSSPASRRERTAHAHHSDRRPGQLLVLVPRGLVFVGLRSGSKRHADQP